MIIVYYGSKEDVRELVAQILAVVVCEAFDDTRIDTFIQDLMKNLKDKPLEQQHGSVLTLGCTISRIVRKYCAPANGEICLYNPKNSKNPKNPGSRMSQVLVQKFQETLRVFESLS